MNEKGGSARTTLAANLGAWLALERGRRVLAVDLDPQAQLARVCGLDPAGARPRASVLDLLADPEHDDAELEGARRGALPCVRSRVPGLDVIPGDRRLAFLPAALRGTSDAWQAGEELGLRLMRALDTTRGLGRYDFVLIDAPPSYGLLTMAALRAARELVVPVPLTVLALESCAELMRSVETVRRRYRHPELTVSLMVGTFYRRTRLAHEILDLLRRRFPRELARTVLGYHVRIDEAQARGLSVFELDPKGRGALALASLGRELEACGAPASVAS